MRAEGGGWESREAWGAGEAKDRWNPKLKTL